MTYEVVNALGGKGEEVYADFERYQEKRFNFEGQWSEISLYMVPQSYPDFRARPLGQFFSSGQKRNQNIYDTTAPIALGRAAAILSSILTPQGRRWHRAMNEDLKDNRQVQLYFDNYTDTLFKYRYAPRANFASQNYQVFRSILSYGTGALFIDDNAMGPGVRYRGVHLSELFIAENHQRQIDKVFRYFSLTLKAAYDQFGDNLPGELLKKLRVTPQEEVEFIHRVQLNGNYDPERLDFEGMRYESTYVSVIGRKVVGMGGFHSMPYAIARYEVTEGEVYGRCPAMDVLPAVKTINQQKKTLLKQGQRAVDPVYYFP